MSEWLKDLPWGKIAAGALTAIAAAVGGTFHLEGDRERQGELTVAQTTQLTEDLRHRGEVCPTIAASEDGTALVKRCASDGCRFVWVQGDGVIFAYYVLAGARIPAPPVATITNISALTFSSPAHAQGVCISYEDHGPPDDPHMPIEYAETNADGWQRRLLHWAHGCTLERFFHLPSGQWANEWRWLYCSGH